jgi:hypothetical protein
MAAPAPVLEPPTAPAPAQPEPPTAEPATAEQQHVAVEAVAQQGDEDPADKLAMQIRDVEQATSCPAMRRAFRPLRTSTDPRVQAFKADLRAHGRRDKHFKCLKRMLGR